MYMLGKGYLFSGKSGNQELSENLSGKGRSQENVKETCGIWKIAQVDPHLFGQTVVTLSSLRPRVRVRDSVSIVYRIATGGYSWIWPQ